MLSGGPSTSLKWRFYPPPSVSLSLSLWAGGKRPTESHKAHRCHIGAKQAEFTVQETEDARCWSHHCFVVFVNILEQLVCAVAIRKGQTSGVVQGRPDMVTVVAGASLSVGESDLISHNAFHHSTGATWRKLWISFDHFGQELFIGSWKDSWILQLQHAALPKAELPHQELDNHQKMGWNRPLKQLPCS